MFNQEFSTAEKKKFDDYLTPGQKDDSENSIKVTFLGTSSLLITDTDTKILIDGFVTRPTFLSLLAGTKPDKTAIYTLIEKYDLAGKLDAVIPVHSHHDHAMDAFTIAKETGADLIGTKSTFNLGDTSNIPIDQLKPAVINNTYNYGKFAITLFPTRHAHIKTSFLRWLLGMGKEIEAPITYPATLWEYNESQPFSILVKHKAGSLLIHASTSFQEGALKNVEADWAFLGISQINKLDKNIQNQYFNETVAAVKASVIVPIHWDDIFRSNDEKLYPANVLMGNFGAELLTLECQMLMYAKPSAIKLMIKNESIFLSSNTKRIRTKFHDIDNSLCL